VLFRSRTTIEANHAQTARQPRLGIRRNQLIKKAFSLRKWVIRSCSTLGVLSVLGGILMVGLYIHHLKAESQRLRGHISYLQQVGDDNAKIANWFNKAFSKTRITAYVPYLGGINGGGKNYANGEPVLPLAASRQALKNGSVAMGDYVILIGQIKDKKGPSIENHSFDIHVPDAETAALIGNRPYFYSKVAPGGFPIHRTP